MRSKNCKAVLGLIFLSFCMLAAGQQQDGRFRRPLAGLRDKFRNRPGIQRPPQAGQLSAAQLDRDGDGSVSEDEIVTTVIESFDDLKQNDPQRFEMLMNRFDQNQNGVIDRDEALEAHAEHQKRMQGNHDGQQSGRAGGERNMGKAPAVNVPDDMGLLNGVKIEGFIPPAK